MLNWTEPNFDPTTIDALKEWLSTPIVNMKQDPITYWTRMEAASHDLVQMAFDFLSIPGKSRLILLYIVA